MSAGKAYRREMVVVISADLRSGRCKVGDIGALKTVLKKVYFAPNPDIQPIIDALRCQRIIAIEKNGKITILPVIPKEM